MNDNGHKFPRSERLRSHKMIGRLFDRNSKDCFTVLVYPYRAVVYREAHTPEGFPEVLVSVPKRNFKKAVLRNRIKRLTREAYRLQKIVFPCKMYIGFLYVGKEVPDFGQAERAVSAILNKLK